MPLESEGWAILFRTRGVRSWQGPLHQDPQARARAVSLETQRGIAAARVMGVSVMAGQRSGSQVGQFRTPHGPIVALGKVTQCYPRRPPRICRGPVRRAPLLLQTLMPLFPGTPPAHTPQHRLAPRGSPSAGRRLRRSAPPPRGPAMEPRRPRLRSGAGTRSPLPGSARRRASLGFRGGRGAVAGGGGCSGGGAPGDRAGPASRSPSPRSVAGPAARCSALERRQGRAQPGPPPPRPSQPGPPLPSPAPAAALPLPSSGEPSPPSRPGRRCAAPGAGESGVEARGSPWARLCAGAGAPPPPGRAGQGGPGTEGGSREGPGGGGLPGGGERRSKPRAGRGLRCPVPGSESAPAGGRCPGRGGARQGRAGRRSSRPEHPRPLPTPAFLLQL